MLFILNLVLIVKLVVECVGDKDATTTSTSTTTTAASFGYFPEHENDIEPVELVCPRELRMVPFFGFKCKTNDDCVVPGEICCQQRNFKICRRGVHKGHRDTVFGFQIAGYQPRIRRLCPSRESFFEILPMQNCTNDADCGLWRICCPDGGTSYCRRAVPQLDTIFSSEVIKTFNNMMSYLQCAPPPPPLLDFFAKPCKNVLDCFPNLCCQEKGRKVCRPSRRSIFPLLTTPT